jgi:hypothetical protein
VRHGRRIEAGAYTVFDAPFTVEQERAYIETLPERAIFLAAESVADGGLVGFQSMEVLDQIRTVDRERLVKRLGALSAFSLAQALRVPREMFAA